MGRAIMTLDIDQEALEFIRGKGGICSIIETYSHQNSYVEIPITSIRYAAPETSTGYDIYERDGITLNIGRSLFFKRNVIRIRLGRFLFFRWLELPTMTMFGGLDASNDWLSEKNEDGPSLRIAIRGTLSSGSLSPDAQDRP